MASKLDLKINDSVKLNTEVFIKKIDSDMAFESTFVSDLLAFEWLEMIEEICPFVDVVIRNPKVQLIKEESIVLVEKSKKTDVSSVKDLAKHTERIKKYNKISDDVEPTKILDIRNEETYNIYENRFLYTVVVLLDKFIARKEKQLKNLELRDTKLLEYQASTVTKSENVNIEVKVFSQTFPNEDINKETKDRIKEIRKRIKRIRSFLSSWFHSPMIKALEAEHVLLLEPPIKMTNVLLKNPNFQQALKLWEYLYKYEFQEHDLAEEEANYKGANLIKGFLDHAFMTNYSVMQSMVASKKEQKKQMCEYAVLLLEDEIKRTTEILKKCSFIKDEEELMKMLAKNINLENKSNKNLAGEEDIKKKFKNAINEYLERTQEDL